LPSRIVAQSLAFGRTILGARGSLAPDRVRRGSGRILDDRDETARGPRIAARLVTLANPAIAQNQTDRRQLLPTARRQRSDVLLLKAAGPGGPPISGRCARVPLHAAYGHAKELRRSLRIRPGMLWAKPPGWPSLPLFVNKRRDRIKLRQPRSHVVAVGSDTGGEPGNTAEAPHMARMAYFARRRNGRAPRRNREGSSIAFRDGP
jgi:hypothetical protein